MTLWMEHEHDDCTGEWVIARKGKGYYCDRCLAFHPMCKESRVAFRNWRYVTALLRDVAFSVNRLGERWWKRY
jgi:hypothetical protein